MKAAAAGLVLVVAMGTLAPTVEALGAPPPGWEDLDRAPDWCLALPEAARPTGGRVLRLDLVAMSRLLEVAPVCRADPTAGALVGVRVPDSLAVITLPTPDGGTERFRFVESPVMPAELQAKYPEVRTYIGQGIDNPASTVHFDLTPLGFHAQVFTPTARGPGIASTDWAGAWYIDPISRGDTEHYVAYRFGDLPGGGKFGCMASLGQLPAVGPTPGLDGLVGRGPGADVPLHVVRIAVAATGEYTAWQSAPSPPNQAAGIAAVATTINRINQVYMRDLAVQLMLAANNDAIIFTDAATDPYVVPSNPDPPRTVPNLADVKSQNPAVINAGIAPGAWDIGHCVHATPTGNGYFGQAGIGVVCGPNAADAASTSGLPNGTYFWIGLVAHEIGHQLGGTHTFNGLAGTCGRAGEYTPASAIEPGSGTTIMSYAGNCDSDNVVTHNPNPAGGGLPETGALEMFGAYTIDQINQWLAMNFCGFNVVTGNHRPSAPTVGGPWLIPANTPFRLNVANVADPDFGQSLSISWEQFNIGAQRNLGPDTGANEPLFRTFNPSGDPERVFPTLATVLGATGLPGENLPRFDRTMLFRAVCRDNFAQGGGVSQSQVAVGVWRTPGDAAFRVTAPAAGTQLCGGQVLAVQWDPVGTADAPVNAPTVDITLSLDGGQTWPITLLADAANSGQAIMAAPVVNTTRARVKVEPPNNIFFSVSPGDFSISAGPPSVASEPVNVSVCPGQPATLAFVPGPNLGGIQWFHNGSPMPGGNAAMLRFANALSTDSGDYHATITNGCGTATTRTVRLQVGVTVDNITGLSTSPVAPCSPVAVTVQARGTGPLTYRWLRNGVELTDGGGVSGSSGATLSLGGARYAAEGTYEIVVTDPCGPRRFFAGELKVAGPVWVQHGLTPAPGGSGQSSEGWTMAYDESRGVTVMYGGHNTAGHTVNSLWEYDGAAWVARYDSSAMLAQPQPGQGFFDGTVAPSVYTAAYSPDHGAVYLVVSAGALYPLRVWRWDGSAWSTIADRAGSGDCGTLLQAAYDRQRQRLVIVRVAGGGGPAEVLDFNPTDGTFAPGPTTPQANGALLFGAKMCYDETRRCVILYELPGNFTAAAMHAYTGVWTTLVGQPATLGRLASLVYDPVRLQAVSLGGDEIGPSCGQWYTGTLVFPGSAARFGVAAPMGSDWSAALPDGAPRNALGAGQSPDNAFCARMMVFDRRRRAMIAVGGRGMSAMACGPTSWDSWERRYLDAPAFDAQPPADPVPSGETLTLTAAPVGAPTLALRWLRNGVVLADGVLPGFPGTTVSGASAATLTVTGPGSAAPAAYRLEAVNACGSVLSSPAIVGMLPSADFNHSGSVTVQDIFDFLAAYFAGDPAADFNNSGGVTVQDIFDFLAAYFSG